MINYNVPLNIHNLNTNLKGNILDDSTMKENGFRVNKFMLTQKQWVFFKYFRVDISITIEITSDNLSIDVLDESFLQPYDYQEILRKTPDHEVALDIHNRVQTIMKQLSDCGIISGYVPNDYI